MFYDVETSFNLAAVFQLKQDYIQPDNIVLERHLISASWKWLGDKKVHVVSLLDDPKRFKKDIHDDTHVCEELHKILSEADVIVAHNGDKFDIKYVETRMLINGLKPLPPINKIDTLKIAKRRFMFNSNKLDYLGKILGIGRKLKTTNGLWLKILTGDEEAIKKMAEYNKGDVLLLEKVFFKLRPFMPNHISRELFGKTGCPRCGSVKVQSRGVHRNATRVYQRFQCQACSGWFRALKAEKILATTRNL